MDTKALDNYKQKKEKLLKDISKFLHSKEKGLALQKNTSNLFRVRNIKNNKIDVKNFNKVIYVDSINLVAEIEGMTTYEDIVQETLKYGCLPSVVPELKSITIGGALAGVGIESSAFRYGLVHETILEYEVLLGDGRIVICRPDNEHKDLYYAFPNTYGTLGYALKVKVKLIPVKKYIKLTHLHFNDPKDYFSSLNQFCIDNKDPACKISYIDGVIFDKKDLYITLGEFVNEVPFVSDYKYKNVYYRSIKAQKTDYLTTLDYIWRWDPDWFWCSKHFLMQNRWIRILFGKFMLKSTVYWKIMNFFNKNKVARYGLEFIRGKTETIIQDIEVPIEQAETFLEFFQHEINIKPIWVCPVLPFGPVPYSFYKMKFNTLYVNFGFWDYIPSTKSNGFYNRKIEQQVQTLEGNKSLYSNSYYTEEEFWKIYDKSLYLQLKGKYDKHHILNDLYKKCVGKGN